jgi:hypothetical protein
MRLGPIHSTQDSRHVFGKPLRQSRFLPLQPNMNAEEDLYYHEAQISLFSWGFSGSKWTELCLVDTYFMSEKTVKYTGPSANNPRESMFLSFDEGMEQIAGELGALVEAYVERMDIYVSSCMLLPPTI